ncbi:hypothetical protein ACFWZ2_02150 [Streptomyces sp. NPDC059002]|uniref:hypothetical protein n=1 Tax=Streptomyces sp. NPDC059002 TaxID=3346690 RepID=UPI0036B0F160
MTLTADSPLRAKPYLHCAPLPDGVYFSGARAQFTLRGWDRLFQVADVCVPLLEDGTSEDALVSALGSERARPVVRRMVDGLRAHGMLLDPARWTVPAPGDAVRERYAGQLAHLESVHPDPYAAFARVRSGGVAVLGPDAALRPALRGLTRAGVGRVVAPGADGTAADATVEAVVGAGDMDVVIWCAAPGDRAEHAARLRDLAAEASRTGTVVLPVRLDDQVLLVGPAIGSGARRCGPDACSALFDRAHSWAGSAQAGPAARPVADALAGALAAQLAFDVLAGLDDDGTAHVVHGAELRSDRVSVARADSAPELGLVRLVEPGAATPPPPELDDAVEAAGVLTRRWTGLFERTPREDQLPQMPLSLRELTAVERDMGPITVWAPHQQAATLAAALEALRGSCPTAHDAVDEMPAAGIGEQQWLLDGALRILVDLATESDLAADDVLRPETSRLRAILDGLLPASHHPRLLHVPGISWYLSTVTDTATGALLGAAWAPDADGAVRDGVSTAIARAQVPGADGESPVAALCTNALLLADADALTALHAQVTAHAHAHRIGYEGRPLRQDPVLGELPFWHGPVRAGSARPSAAKENHEH